MKGFVRRQPAEIQLVSVVRISGERAVLFTFPLFLVPSIPSLGPPIPRETITPKFRLSSVRPHGDEISSSFMDADQSRWHITPRGRKGKVSVTMQSALGSDPVALQNSMARDGQRGPGIDPPGVAVDDSRSCQTFGNDADMLHEILKHLDAESVGRVSCVSRRWRQAAYNEHLWEVICTRQWPAKGLISAERLKTVVVALGGFRRLYVNCLHPLLSRRGGPSILNSNCCCDNLVPKQCLWSEDEIHLSLSLFSIDYYERIVPLTSCYNAGSSLDILNSGPRSALSDRFSGPDVKKLLRERRARCGYQFSNKDQQFTARDELSEGVGWNRRKRPHDRRQEVTEPINSKSMKIAD